MEQIKDPFEAICADVRSRTQIDEATLNKLGLNETGNSSSCFIESFSEIGWKDPFPT